MNVPVTLKNAKFFTRESPSQNYRVLLVIWDRTMLLAARRKRTHE